MEAKDIRRAIKKHGAEKNVSYDDKYFVHNMPELMCIAEISSRAGYKQRNSEIQGAKEIIGEAKKKSYEAGIREVVEWINENGYYTDMDLRGFNYGQEYRRVTLEEWQAKLKSWNIGA